MQVVITAVGPDNRGLADPIVHSVTGMGANIAEIQMYDHDEESVFSMLTRIELDPQRYDELRQAMNEVARRTKLSIRTWTPEIVGRRPRLAICVTYRPEPALALLRAIRDGQVKADAQLMIGNRDACRGLAEQFGLPWYNIAETAGTAGGTPGTAGQVRHGGSSTSSGTPDNERMIALCDEHEVDFIVLARYMRILPAASCWKYAGGRIINLHHGLLPSFPGMQPYHEAFASRMLTYGATCHFIVPELDAGCQIIYQSTFTVPPGMPRDEIIRRGQEDNEPHCLVEGVRRVVDGEVQLHFNRVVARK
ncbi:MAG TPA: formyltransferase family protein [Lacipirellulaceae bacterium]